MEHMQKLMTLQWKISNNIKAFYAEIKKKIETYHEMYPESNEPASSQN